MARREGEIAELARRFVCVRLVRMNGVDLGQFRFDFDMTWAALFLNADGTVYSRYGSRDATDAMASNSLAGLASTLRAVLRAHESYPQNRGLFEGKRATAGAFARPEEAPGWRGRGGNLNDRGGCIHCHNVHDAELALELAHAGRPTQLYPYPLPENLGLSLRAESGRYLATVSAGSAAALAGLAPGDALLSANGQAVFSIADLQHVLQGLGSEASLRLDYERRGETRSAALELRGDWRRNDFSWRPSRRAYPPSPDLYLRQLEAAEREPLKLAADRLALEVVRVFSEEAQRSGLRDGDLILSLDGESSRLSATQFTDHLRVRHYFDHTAAKLEVLRKGERVRIEARFFAAENRK